MTWFQQVGCGGVCALVLGIGDATAEYGFDVWTAESGLPQNTVRDIVQTRDGYLWVATLDGLARFDGVRFTVFNKANSPGLSSNRILALYEDHKGDLWIGLDDGGLVRNHLGRFTRCGTGKGGPPGVGIRTISGDAIGNLWVSLGAAPFQWQDGTFRPALPENVASLLPHDQFRENREGIFWAINRDGVHIFSRGNLTTLRVTNGPPSLRINHVDQDQHGNWWLATEDAGLVKLRDGKVLKIYTAQDGLPRPTVNPKVSWIYPSVALEDRKGNLWLNGAGPWLGRLKDGIFSAYPSADTSASHPLRLTPGPAGSQINKLLEDREGNLWIGTEGSGLIRAREQIVNVVSTKQGLHAANIYPVFEDRAGAVWLGTWDLGMARVSAGVVTNFPLGFPHGNVTAFCQDRASRLWVGTIGGVFIFEQDTVSMTGVPASFAHLPVSAICEDHDGVLWFGAERGLFQLQNGELTLRAPNEVPGVIKVIIAAQDGSLWIGSRSGLTRLTNGRFTTWTEKDGLPSDNVTALYEDEGALWIGTADGGLARFQGGRFTSYTTREGMFDNGVYQILEDADGNLWMSSNRGIYRVSKAELNEVAAGRRRSITSIAYGRSDGMLNPECNGGRSPAGVRTRDGRLWFPTQDGVAVIDPAALSPNPKPPPVVIESFLVDRAPQSLSTAVRVPPGKSNIEIQYTGLSLVNSERIRFKYRLGGAGDDWLEAGPRRTAYYSHLAPGHYTFTVLAANSDGVWNDIGASLAFAVLPAWHQTAWFRGVAVLAIVGLAVGFYRRRVSRLETQHAAQQNFSRRLIDSQEQERKRIAAELHDSLGQHLLVIKNRAALGLNSTAAGAPEQLTEISRAATQALEEVREISQNLRPYQLDRLGLTRALHGLVKKVGTSSALNCVADITPLDGLFPPEAQINLFRIVQEGLNNILKHSGATEARVIVERDAAGVRLLIADNGRGFDSQTASASPARAGGMGLNGIAERVRILRGRLDIEASPGGGTRLQIELPLPLAENKS